MQIQPYLFLDGRCEEALDFYRNAIGAEVTMLMRFSESPEPPQQGCMSDVPADKVMHSEFRVGETVIMASDGMSQGRPEFKGFALALAAPDVAAADRLFAALAEGGAVQMPLAATFFSPRFGMVADRFGVSWMIIVPA
jgi:PhnB protein